MIMKTTILLLFLLIPAITSAQITIPSLSSSAYIKQTIGLTDITVDYSRPSAKGRVIFGESGLLPTDELWRTGANNATKISFTSSVSILGHDVEEGNYTILSIPGEKVWMINWYPYESTNWNSYVEKEPLFTLELNVEETETHVETFEISFQDISLNSASISLKWENTLIQIPIKVNENEQILKSIERTLAGPSNSDYFQAALYLHESKGDLTKALEYIQVVTASENAQFFQVTREAQILLELGKNKEALNVAKRGLSLSEEIGNNDFIRLNKKIIRQLGSH